MIWITLSTVPIGLVFLLWNLEIISTAFLATYGIVEWLLIRPKLNTWRLRYQGVTREFTFWQGLTLSFTHRRELWNS